MVCILAESNRKKKKSQEKPYYALACGISLNARFNTAVF